MNDGSIDDEFLKSLFFYAVVIRSDFPTIQELKEYLAKKGLDVKFQKLSTNYLRIEEGGHDWTNKVLFLQRSTSLGATIFSFES